MPTYEYECRACGHEFETMHGMTAPVLRKCPKCAKLKLVRLISGGAGVIFKGSGFYETDYKAKRGGGAAESDAKQQKAEESAKSETKADPKTETKKDTKSEAKSGGTGESKSDSKPKKDTGPKKD
jgi:putative FmdB family regulatory protein